MISSFFALCCFHCFFAFIIPVDSETPGDVKPSFEVASVKRDTLGKFSVHEYPGGRFVATGVTFQFLVMYAYRVEFTGGPNWITSDQWFIEARAEEGTIPPQTGPRESNLSAVDDPFALRLQSLLEDRFQLKYHLETRDLPVYELTIAKSGLKMKLSDDQSTTQPRKPGDPPPPPLKSGAPLPRGVMRVSNGEHGIFGIETNGIQLSSLVGLLSQRLGRKVIDKTDLNGLYDIKLEWTDEIPRILDPLPEGTNQIPLPNPLGPSIFTAIEEQLGMKLVSKKAPVEVLVIDSLQKPAEN